MIVSFRDYLLLNKAKRLEISVYEKFSNCNQQKNIQIIFLRLFTKKLNISKICVRNIFLTSVSESTQNSS